MEKAEIPPTGVPIERGSSSSTKKVLGGDKPSVGAMGRLLREKLLGSYLPGEIVQHADFQRQIEHVRFDQSERGNIVCYLREAGYLVGVDGQKWRIQREE